MGTGNKINQKNPYYDQEEEQDGHQVRISGTGRRLEGVGGAGEGEAGPLLPQSAGQAVSAPPGEEPALSPPQNPAKNQSQTATTIEPCKESVTHCHNGRLQQKTSKTL